MSRAPAFAYLCNCLSCAISGRQPSAAFAGDVHWPTFIALSHEYRVSSAVGRAWNSASADDRPPKNVRALFESLAAHQRQHNERVRKQAIEVSKILNGVGIVPMFLKGGAHILAGLYPDSAMRQSADLDVLIPKELASDATAALNNFGIRPLTSYLHPRAHHQQPVGRDDLAVPIELHHEVLAYPNWQFLTPDELLSSGNRIDEAGVKISIPSPTQAVLHNIAHAQLGDHDFLFGRVDLRGMMDFALLSKNATDSIDWDEVNRRFLDIGRRNALEYHFAWARRIGAKVPSWKKPRFRSRMLYQRSVYHVRNPRMLSLSFRLLRPLTLLRRELSEPLLRRRLAGNILRLNWWKRHLRMLKGT